MIEKTGLDAVIVIVNSPPDSGTPTIRLLLALYSSPDGSADKATEEAPEVWIAKLEWIPRAQWEKVEDKITGFCGL